MWADWWGFKLEAFDGIRENIALVDEASGCAIVHSDDPERHPAPEPGGGQGDARRARGRVHDRAARTRSNGCRSIPAKALGIDKMTGSLEAGKRADVVIWSADPFSVYARTEEVFVDGALLYDRNDPQKQPLRDFAAGTAQAGEVR